MRRRINRLIAATAIAALVALAPVTAASAATYGGYKDLGTCNYWRYAVAATGARVTNCYLKCPPGCTAPGPNYWYFSTY